MTDDSTDVVGLTEQEIDAIKNDPDDSAVDDAKGDVVAGSGDDDSNDDSGETKTTDADVGQPDVIQANESEPFVPEYKANAPDNIADQYKQLDTSYETLSVDLEQKFENGDITFVEYRKQARDLDSRYFTEKAKLDEARIKSTIAQEQSEQVAEQRWQWEQDTFFRDSPEFKKDPIMYGALDATLKVMAQDQANAGKTGLQLLREAGATVKARFEPTKSDSTVSRAGRRETTRPVMPATLTNVPSAGMNTEGGEFDYMDKLNGLAYEAALSKLSEDQRNRFLMN